MSHAYISTKLAINNALELSIKGKTDKAFFKLYDPSLCSDRSEKIKEILESTRSKNIDKCHTERLQIFHLLTEPQKIDFSLKMFEEFESKTAGINFAGPDFRDFMTLLHCNIFSEKKILKSESAFVSSYHNVKKLREKFNFKNNGFQFCALDQPLIENVEKLASNPYDSILRSMFSTLSTQFIASWAKKNHIQFDQVAPLGIVYRTADAADGKAERPFPIAHVDFQQSSLRDTMLCLQDIWKPEIESALGSLSREQYARLPIVQMVNLWLPVNKLPTENGLAVVDKSTLVPSKDLRPFIHTVDVGSFNSLLLNFNQKQKWVAQEVMTLGDAVIFNSFETPHSAMNSEKDPSITCDLHRRSFEIRFALIKY